MPTPIEDAHGRSRRPSARSGLRIALALTAAAISAAGAAPAQAATQLKAGLWEQQLQMKSQSGRLEAALKQAEAAMAAMPAEQRKMMQEMMARRGMGMGVGGPRTVRVCLTQADVERNEPPPQQGCQTQSARNGDVWSVTYDCPGQGRSEGTITLDSPTAYHGQFRLRAQADGHNEVVDMSTQGRWLGANCGAVAPMSR
jgi:hypothetical protein